MHFILVTYDIENDRRRTKIHKILSNFGEPVQYSVFECFISEGDFEEMRKKLKKQMDPNHPDDSIRYYTLCRCCVEKVLVEGNRDFNIEGPFIIS
ncbi:MAG: CRISPR-associated endonuclease Cas2 [Prosthecochloris sp.]|nr:CRISPR-associated endonuclease Cas2 [Prosthecochloris sp.]